MSKKPISKDGMNCLLSELKNLTDFERPPVMIAIAEARELGDLSENAEYQLSREKQRHIDKRIRELENIIKNSEVIDISDIKCDKVGFGSTVDLEDENGKKVCYKILGETESDFSKGVISVSSPIACAIMGKKAGDFVNVRTPSGIREFEICDIK